MVKRNSIVVSGSGGAGQGDGSLVPARRTPTPTELITLTLAAIDGRVVAGQEFSAWEITKELRADSPALEIDHDQVRRIVNLECEQHRGMDVHVESFPSGESARVYSTPKPIQVAATVVSTRQKLPRKASARSISGSPLMLMPGIEEVK